MKPVVKIVMGVVALGAMFVFGMMLNERLIYAHCLNDTGYTQISGESFACIVKPQFIIQFLQGGAHGKDGNT